ncbi:UDP-glucuronosyltransferase 1-6 [Lucilia cuprina]|nr:UDP-glucuronosyltransferase 1-6 [Lucilia cuprina]
MLHNLLINLQLMLLFSCTAARTIQSVLLENHPRLLFFLVNILLAILCQYYGNVSGKQFVVLAVVGHKLVSVLQNSCGSHKNCTTVLCACYEYLTTTATCSCSIFIRINTTTMILSPCYTTDCQYYANIYSQPINSLESNKVIKMKLTLSLIGLSLVFASLIVPQTEAARILGIFPSPSKSHLLIHCAVADTLAEAGHEVTVISTVPNLYKRAKYNFIHVQGAMYDEKFANKMVNKPAPAYVKFYNVMSSVMTMANTTINHPTMQDFLQHHKAGDFDLVILGYFMNDFFLGIGAHFQCPVIVSFMVQPIFPINNMIANPLEASYVQTIFSGVRQPMDFWSRVKNLLSVAIEEIVLMNVLRLYNANMNKMYSVISILVSIACCAVIQCQAARILGVFPSPSKSHVLIHCAVADALAEAGHEVTVIATVPNMLKKAKYNFLHVEGAMFDSNFAQEMLNKPASIYRKFNGIISHVIDMANVTMNQPKIQNFLQTHKAGDFDAVILGYFMNDFMLGFGAHFQCPIILSFMVQPIFPINKMIGNPLEASYVPTLYSGYKQPMDFASRVKNFLANGFEHLVLGNLMQRKLETMYGYNFPADRYPPLEEVYKNVSLVLTNHHFSQGPIRPNVPALIEIGGIQIKEKPDPLPQDLAEIIESSDKGVIFFSLGTNVQGSNLSKDKAKMIFNVLSKLPYTVLLKWGDSDFPGQSKNMIYRSWLPQDDILAHPKVKLFITHGGMGSVVESQYHGVPMVGIPFFGDQHSNIANVVKSGFGLGLEYARFSEEAFRQAVVEVLENPTYTQNVQKFSELYRDRPMTPRQLVRYWVDYVIRHNGAKHMQSPAINMTWWQLYSLDVIAFLLSIILGVVALLVGLCKLLCCRGKGATKAATKKVSKSKKQKYLKS